MPTIGMVRAIDKHEMLIGSEEQDALAVPDIKNLQHHEPPAPPA